MNAQQKIRFKSYMEMAQENLQLAKENDRLKKELEEYQVAYKILLRYHCLKGRVV